MDAGASWRSSVKSVCQDVGGVERVQDCSSRMGGKM